jgi:hypothetical protein
MILQISAPVPLSLPTGRPCYLGGWLFQFPLVPLLPPPPEPRLHRPVVEGPIERAADIDIRLASYLIWFRNETPLSCSRFEGKRHATLRR